MASNFADALYREVAFLTTIGDGLPALLVRDGGRFDNIQAYWTRTPPRQRAAYLVRDQIHKYKSSFGRSRYQYDWRLRITWSTSEPTLEQDQQDLDLALNDMETRINGPAQDKTHGGRFLAVAATVGDGPGLGGHPVVIRFDLVEQTVAVQSFLRAEIVYKAFDEFTN